MSATSLDAIAASLTDILNTTYSDAKKFDGSQHGVVIQLIVELLEKANQIRESGKPLTTKEREAVVIKAGHLLLVQIRGASDPYTLLYDEIAVSVLNAILFVEVEVRNCWCK